MIQNIKNPYQIIGDQFAEGLANIESNLKSDMTFDELNNLVYKFLQPKYFPNPDILDQFSIKFSNIKDVALDIEVSGGAYFIAKDTGGSNYYTKYKQFIVNPNSYLATNDLDYILQSYDGVSPLFDISIPFDIKEFCIPVNGKIYTKSILTPQTFDFLAQIGVATFSNPENLTDLGNGYYAENIGSGTPVIGLPQGIGSFANVSILLKNPSAQPDQFTETNLKSIGINAVNRYLNTNLNSGFASGQSDIYSTMINGLINVPIENIGKILENLNENIGKSGMTLEQQAPLYMSLAIAQAAYDYWMTAIANIGNNWYTYGFFNADVSSNRASIPYWLGAAICGTIAANNDSNLLSKVNSSSDKDMITSLLGGLIIGAGKILYRWEPLI